MAQRCFIGTLMVKVGQALLLTWGKTNVYYYSYYRHLDESLPYSYNNLAVGLMALPAAIITIFSVKIAKKLGFERVIRAVGIIQCASLLLASRMDNYPMFILFFLIIFGVGYSFIAFPVITCLWSHYQKKEGKVTGLIFAALGIATFAFIIIITYMVNPRNESAQLEDITGKQSFKYFDYSVAQNVPDATLLIGIIAGFSSLIGSFMVQYNRQEAVQIELGVIEEEKSLEAKDKGDIDKDIDKDVENIDVEDKDLYQYQYSRTEIKVTGSLKKAIFSSQLIIILLCQAVLMFYVITLGMNYKGYSLKKINNDYYVTIVDMVALIASAASNVIWGILSDKINFKILLGLTYVFTGLTGTLFPIFASEQVAFAGLYISMMIFYKGAIVIVGPGLIKIFGQDLGHQLFPLTYAGSLFAFICSPIAQHFLLKSYTMDLILISQGILILINQHDLSMNQINKCLIGALLMKAAQSLLMTWGKSNVYYYSYYALREDNLSIAYNTLPIALMGIPFAIVTVYSIQIAERVGFELLIRSCAIVQFFSYLIAPFQSTYLGFIILYLIIPGFAYALLGFPLVQCLWSHFKNTEGKATGMVFMSFGIANLIFVISATTLINPSNSEADQQLMIGQQIYRYFGEKVAENVQMAVLILGLIAGSASVIGSMMVNKKTDEYIEMQNLDQPKEMEISDVIRTRDFKMLYLCYLSIGLFETTIGLNYKTYGLSKINNDYLLTIVDMLATVVSAAGNIFWGKLIDQYPFEQILFRIFISLGALVIIFPLCISHTISFALEYIILSICAKGAFVIVGPGLLKIFGSVGAKAFPIINTSSLVSFIIAPLIQFALIKYIKFDGLFVLYGILIIVAIIIK